MFRGAWHTLLESTWSLVSHPRNGSSFGLPNKSYGQFIGKCSGGQQSREASLGIHSEGTFRIAFPQKLYFSYLSRRVVPSINIPTSKLSATFDHFDKLHDIAVALLSALLNLCSSLFFMDLWSESSRFPYFVLYGFRSSASYCVD